MELVTMFPTSYHVLFTVLNMLEIHWPPCCWLHAHVKLAPAQGLPASLRNPLVLDL